MKDTQHPKLTRRTPKEWKQSFPSCPQNLMSAESRKKSIKRTGNK